MKKYEYNYWDNLSLNDVNNRGQDGWELVSVAVINMYPSYASIGSKKIDIERFYFKREVLTK